ncbi:hypothetical protein ACHAQA_007978 [Verticillium albo-atrum]
MSPIAVEKQEAYMPPSVEIVVGPYKEQATDPNAYNRKLEEEGTCDAPGVTPFTHVEPGLAADKSFPDLLNSSVKTEDLTPTIGTAISGIQLSSLSAAGKDQLALLCAQRKVLHFLDQDFADLPIPEALEFSRHFGHLHIHPTSGSPEGYPEVHLVYRAAHESPGAAMLESRTSTAAWHSDVSYEHQPPGTTILYILDSPTTGGDTVLVDQVEAYRRLSPEFRKRLHGLQVVHSGLEQVNAAKVRGSICRREPVTSIHPIVRTHPATGEKALFVNPQCK